MKKTFAAFGVVVALSTVPAQANTTLGSTGAGGMGLSQSLLTIIAAAAAMAAMSSKDSADGT